MKKTDPNVIASPVTPLRRQWKPAWPTFAVLAVWFGIWLWSTLAVQPRANGLYQRRAQQALSDAGIIDASGKPIELANWLEHDDAEKLSLKLRALNDACLYLRRLIDVMPDVSKLTLQLALAQEASAKLNVKLADQARRRGDAHETEAYARKAYSASLFAQETMERLSKSSSEEAVVARSWELARRLKLPIRDDSSMSALFSSAEAILAKDPKSRIGRVRFGQLRIQEAYALDETAIEQRRASIQEAVALLSSIDSPTMVEQAFLAEALDAESSEQALQQSIDASQRYWDDASSERQSPEGIAALFSCLMRLGSTQEAQTLLVKSLSNLAPVDQMAMRGLCSEFCVRQLVCQHAFPAEGRPAEWNAILSLGARLDPQSKRFFQLLQRTIVNDGDDEFATKLMETISRGTDLPLQQLVMSLREARKEHWEEVPYRLAQVGFERDAGLSSVTVALVHHLMDEGVLRREDAIRFLLAGLEASPEAVGIHIESALFFEKIGKREQAADCLEGILAKTPGDAHILSFLATIYSKLDRTDDLKRVQAELQKIRKRPAERN